VPRDDAPGQPQREEQRYEEQGENGKATCDEASATAASNISNPAGNRNKGKCR